MNPELVDLLIKRRRELRMLRPDAIDISGLQYRFVTCSPPTSCQGQCCNGGAGLLETEAQLLVAFARHEQDRLNAIGVTSPGVELGQSCWRTTLHTPPFLSGCSWKMPDGRCSLHHLALEDGCNWWAYKPLACSLFPFRIRSRQKLHVLTVDRRCEATDGPPCTRLQIEESASKSASMVLGEFAVVSDLWMLDLAAMQSDCSDCKVHKEDVNTATQYCVAATQKHILFWVKDGEDGGFLEKKSRNPNDAGGSLLKEYHLLQQTDGLWFPRALSFVPKELGGPVLRMEYLKGRVPLDLWLRTRPKLSHVVRVVIDLLRACEAMEKAGLFHLDLAMRNVLVEPTSFGISIVDFENVASNSRQQLCNGGQWGLAAPEQYLDRLGYHTHRTETFFCGAVLWKAISDRYGIPRQAMIPLMDHHDIIPDMLKSALTGLIGDPKMGFSPSSRIDAETAIALLSNVDRVALDVDAEDRHRRKQTFRYDHHAADIEHMEIQGPNGYLIQAEKKAIRLFLEGKLIDSLPGLVDLTNLPHQWTVQEYRFGPWICNKSGFKLVTGE